MTKIADGLEKVLKAAILLLLSAMTVVVVIGIVARYILLISLPWTEEMSRYLMIWTGFVAFGLAYRKRELIYIKLLLDRLPPKLLKTASVTSDLLCSLFLVLAIGYGVKLCLGNAGQVSPAARIPMSLIYAAIPVGCAICLLYICESLVAYFRAGKA